MAVTLGAAATITLTEQGHSSPGVVESNIRVAEHELQLQTAPRAQDDREQPTPTETSQEEGNEQTPEDAMAKDTTEAEDGMTAKARAANREKARAAMSEWREARKREASKSE